MTNVHSDLIHVCSFDILIVPFICCNTYKHTNPVQFNRITDIIGRTLIAEAENKNAIKLSKFQNVSLHQLVMRCPTHLYYIYIRYSQKNAECKKY